MTHAAPQGRCRVTSLFPGASRGRQSAPTIDKGAGSTGSVRVAPQGQVDRRPAAVLIGLAHRRPGFGFQAIGAAAGLDVSVVAETSPSDGIDQGRRGFRPASLITLLNGPPVFLVLT